MRDDQGTFNVVGARDTSAEWEGTVKLLRRQFLQVAAGAAALPAASRTARAQTYPTRPITMIVPFPPGGANDMLGRIIAERMRDILNQSIVIENIGGAAGSIGVGREFARPRTATRSTLARSARTFLPARSTHYPTIL